MITNYYNFWLLHPYFSYFFLGILFLCVGSFLNVVIVRLPKMIFSDLEKNCQITLRIPLDSRYEKLDLITMRSHCTHCKAKIPFWYNIPVISFFILRGSCSNCRQKISWFYPIIEILTAMLSLLAVYIFDFSWQLIYVLPFIWIMICLCFIDINTKILPDCLTLSLLWIGLLANINNLYTSLPDAIYATICGYLGLWIFIKGYYLLTGKIGMGGGDFKLFAALGAWFGLRMLPYILIISSILGIIFGAIYLFLLRKPRNTPIAFGPFLALTGAFFLFIASGESSFAIRILQ